MKNVAKSIAGFCCTLILLSTPAICAQWQDITNSFEVSNTRPVFDRINRQMNVYVTIKNVSQTTYASRFRLLVSQPNLTITNHNIDANGNAGFSLPTAIIQPSADITVKIAYGLSRRALSYIPIIEQEVIAIDASTTHEEVVTANEGGVLALSDGITMIVPPKAVESDQSLTIEFKDISDSAKQIQLGPNGSAFKKPVAIIIETDTEIENYDFYFYSDSLEAKVIGSQTTKVEPLSITKLSSNTAVVEIEHFSYVDFILGRDTYPVFAIPYKYLQPADLIYNIVKRDYWGIGWLTGHAQMYAGEYTNQDGDGAERLRIIQSENEYRGDNCQSTAPGQIKSNGKYYHDGNGTGVYERCDVVENHEYYSSLKYEHMMVGIKRHKFITPSLQSEIIDSAEKLIGSPYTLIGNDNTNSLSCVGFTEKAYGLNGLIMSLSDKKTPVNFITPVEQFHSPFLEDVNSITLDTNEKIEDIPVYSFSRNALRQLKLYSPTVVNQQLPHGLSFQKATCDNKVSEGEYCDKDKFKSARIHGTVDASAANTTFWITIETTGALLATQRTTLYFHVNDNPPNPSTALIVNSATNMDIVSEEFLKIMQTQSPVDVIGADQINNGEKTLTNYDTIACFIYGGETSVNNFSTAVLRDIDTAISAGASFVTNHEACSGKVISYLGMGTFSYQSGWYPALKDSTFFKSVVPDEPLLAGLTPFTGDQHNYSVSYWDSGDHDSLIFRVDNTRSYVGRYGLRITQNPHKYLATGFGTGFRVGNTNNFTRQWDWGNGRVITTRLNWTFDQSTQKGGYIGIAGRQMLYNIGKGI